MKNKTHKKQLIIRSILVLTLLLSQNVFSQVNKSPSKVPSYPYRSFDECQKLVLEKGDTKAYYDLYWILTKQDRHADYVFYSLFMLEKYNYTVAHYWIFVSLESFYRISKIPFEGEVLKFALEHLMKGAECGVPGAQKQLGELYLEGKYVERDTVKGKELWLKGGGSIQSITHFLHCK